MNWMTKYLLGICIFIGLQPSQGTVCTEAELMENLWRKKPNYEKEITSTGGISWTPRSILRDIGSKNCTVYRGNIKVKKFSSENDGFEEHVRNQDLENLRNLQEIYGCVYLSLEKYPDVKTLSFLSGLRKIETSDRLGFTLLQSEVAMIDFSYIRLNVPRIAIAYNKQLCYLDRISTINSTIKHMIIDNKDQNKCQEEGKICSRSCDASKGCWGPADHNCFSCRDWRAGDDCVVTCEARREFFTPPTASRVCGRCHPNCKYGCFGANISQCYSSIDHCPKYKYFNNVSEQCEECSPMCFGSGYDKRRLLTVPACSGPGNFAGRGGCSLECQGTTYLTISSDGLLECPPCHSDCLTCRNEGFSGCIEFRGNPTPIVVTVIMIIVIIGLVLAGVCVYVVKYKQEMIPKMLRPFMMFLETLASPVDVEAGGTQEATQLILRGTPGLEIHVVYHPDQFSVNVNRFEFLSMEQDKNTHYRSFVCIVPGLRSGKATFADVKNALQPLFDLGNIRGIEQRRGIKDGNTVISVDHLDDADNKTGDPGYANTFGQYCQSEAVTEMKVTAITSFTDDEMEKQLRKKADIDEVNKGGEVLIVPGRRRSALQLHDLIIGVELCIVFRNDQFSVSATRPEVQSWRKFPDSETQYLNCIVPRLSAGWVTFHDVKKALKPLFDRGSIRAIEQHQRRLSFNKFAVLVAPPDDADNESGESGYFSLDGRHFTSASEHPGSIHHISTRILGKKSYAIVHPNDDDVKKGLKKKNIEVHDKRDQIFIVTGRRRTVLVLHDLPILDREIQRHVATKLKMLRVGRLSHCCWMTCSSTTAIS